MATSEFITLAAWLRRDDDVAIDAAPIVIEERVVASPTAKADEVPPDVVEAIREARRFRAALADAFDDVSQRLLRNLAADVLARELRAAPCEIDEIVRRVATAVPAVRVRVAPCDAHRVTGLAVVSDDSLVSGDAVVELDDGLLDMRLGVRLAGVLEATR